jgi:hypothetical protein
MHYDQLSIFAVIEMLYKVYWRQYHIHTYQKTLVRIVIFSLYLISSHLQKMIALSMQVGIQGPC